MNEESKFEEPANPSRRKILKGLAATTAGAAVLAGCSSDISDFSSASMPVARSLPAPEKSGIDHIVVVMMENRSFDHYLGWLPGADGVQEGRRFIDTAGKTQMSHHLTDFQNCASADPDHSYEGGRKEFNNGTMDGFLQPSVPGDIFPIGYYAKNDLPFIGPAAENWTVCDRYFCSILAETYPNRFYMHSGQTDRLHNTMATSTLPTIWDALKAKGLKGNYYFSDIPFTTLWANKYLDISQPFAAFLADAALGQLPQVSYIDPRFLGEGNGVSNDDHPLADVRNGQAFLNQIYDAIRQSPQYENTLLIINYDEWGGFADHVAPDFAPITSAERTLGNDGRLGFRVPCMLIGPRVKRGHVEHLAFDHTSILNLMLWRWDLQPFYPRAMTSNNMALALDFTNPPNTTAAPVYTVPTGPFGTECDLASHLPAGTGIGQLDAVNKSRAAHILDLQMLKTKAQRSGFPI